LRETLASVVAPGAVSVVTGLVTAVVASLDAACNGSANTAKVTLFTGGACLSPSQPSSAANISASLMAAPGFQSPTLYLVVPQVPQVPQPVTMRASVWHLTVSMVPQVPQIK